ncbi:sensor histidine kinase [Jatrophihabitans endophyticus]|uniref:sensor histidine kinase n=1 Tax=Jatrophihabitans endophyticus TaxID=1206085 RepID=UPI000932676C|nr:ATP-binding protein [Jatrophihabitans endophyticus]
MGRGALRIYLGAAPGVGKTVAMLDEGRRRLERGADVVVAIAETHGRAHTARSLGSLPAVPRRTVTYRGAEFGELDLAALLARRPAVALVDELAHTNVPGSGPHEHRWQDVQAMLDAGIDVISTINVQHLESLHDVVADITGVAQRETVPDRVVRAAEQVELVDMTAEALRRRLAHGNVYPAERVDAALGSYFRVGNLTALRELSLLWLADGVDEGLQRYRAQHGILRPWETRERIVVALTGGPESDTLIRRATRIASRSAGSQLLAVHVARSDGLAARGVTSLAQHRLLVESLGGTYHLVVGDRVPETLVDFAARVDATQLVLGTARRTRLASALTGPGTGAAVSRLAGSVDVHLVPHDRTARGPGRLPRLSRGLTTGRRVAGLLLASVLLPVLTLGGVALRPDVDLAAGMPLYLLVVVVTSLVGGAVPALLCALAAALLLNYYFVEPLHTLAISSAADVVAVAVFVLIAALVSQVVDLAARRSSVAARAGAEAEALSTFAGGLVRGESDPASVLERVRDTFGMDGAALLGRGDDGSVRTVLAAAGWVPGATVADADATVVVDDATTLALRGHALPAADLRVLSAFAAHVVAAYRRRRLADAAAAAAPLAESDRQRTALLNAVGHDLRTPIAAAKTAVSSLRAAEVRWDESQRAEFLATAEDSLDRLTDLVTNLLDLSRLQAGAMVVVPGTIGVDDVVARALDHVDPAGAVRVDVPAELSEARADAGLLERVVANVVANGLRHTAPGTAVLVTGSEHADVVELRVVDRGPGIPAADVTELFRPFRRGGDGSADGVGLGLAIARGFTEAMGGTVAIEPTPGGGATVVIALPRAGGAR